MSVHVCTKLLQFFIYALRFSNHSRILLSIFKSRWEGQSQHREDISNVRLKRLLLVHGTYRRRSARWLLRQACDPQKSSGATIHGKYTTPPKFTALLSTVKAPNFGPHGNIGPLFQKGLLSLRRVLQKNIENNESCSKTLGLQIRFCSFLVHDSSKQATELARKSPKFSWGPKLEAFRVL